MRLENIVPLNRFKIKRFKKNIESNYLQFVNDLIKEYKLKKYLLKGTNALFILCPGFPLSIV